MGVKKISIVFLAGAMLMIVGCASTVENTNVPVVDAGQANTVTPQPGTYPSASDNEFEPVAPAPGNNSNHAVLALLGSAEQQTQRGDYVGAAGSLERAIRISPRDGSLYYQLAQVRYLQANYHQAEQLCRKAISLAAGDNDLLANSRSLMARAQKAAQSN
jgi:tetratricopeptide (TPR) repeat protein